MQKKVNSCLQGFTFIFLVLMHVLLVSSLAHGLNRTMLGSVVTYLLPLAVEVASLTFRVAFIAQHLPLLNGLNAQV